MDLIRQWIAETRAPTGAVLDVSSVTWSSEERCCRVCGDVKPNVISFHCNVEHSICCECIDFYISTLRPDEQTTCFICKLPWSHYNIA